MGDIETSRATVSAALIGCGNIGSLYDEGADGPARSHASALAALGVDLVAVCDVNSERARTCAAVRSVDHWYTDAAALFADHRPDIVCIGTPTAIGRIDLVRHAVDAGAKALLIEKPLERTLAEAEQLAELVREVPCAVNYQRSWSRGVREAVAWSGQLGALDRYVVHYDKGFSNNASHALDLVRHFVGWPDETRVLRVRDDGREDRTADVLCHHGDAVGYFIGGDYRRFSRFEIELVFEEGRIVFAEGGHTVRLERPRADPDYPAYRRLRVEEVVERALDDALVAALGSLVAAVDGDRSGIACTLDDALATMRALHDVQCGIEEL